MDKNQKKSTSLLSDTKPKPKTHHYNVGWVLMKSIVYFFGIVCVLTVASAFYYINKSNVEAGKRSYIITNAGTLIAEYTDINDLKSREIELRNHVSLFFNKMYAFNEYTFKDNVEYALHMIGPDGKKILSAYNQAGVYESLVNTSSSVTVSVDSMWVDMATNPYRTKAFVRQFLQTPSGVVTKRLWSEMTVRELGNRDPMNIHGLLIDNLKVVDNTTLDVTKVEEEIEE